jgi:predicted SnoaL-like aldol condensation-catalyzing enzyme
VIPRQPAVCPSLAAVFHIQTSPQDRRQLQRHVLTRRKPMSETNKDIAVAFYKKALFEGQVEDAFRLYAGPTYRQHNPLIEDGMEGVKKFITWIMSNHPDARGEIKRVFADGDHVILHSHWYGLSDNSRGEAVVDIFRLEDGKVFEHWDVIQPIPETSANANTMF